MLRVSQIFLAGVLLLALCCPVLSQRPRDKNTSDVERLQGTWLADLEPGLQGRLELDGSHLLYVHVRDDRETLVWDGHFAINEKARPKEMDWTPLRRNNPSPPSSLAIYQLEGDLLLVIGSTESERPTAFYSGGGRNRPKTVIFRRQNKKDNARRRIQRVTATATAPD